MNWLTSKRSGSGSAYHFDGCAVCVVLSSESSASERVKLVLSDGLVSAYRLQSGDRLQVGFSDDGRFMLRRHSLGNTVSGRGFSDQKLKSGKKGGSTTQPYVAFERGSYPAVWAWAKQFTNRTWIEVVDHGTHWESVH